MKKKESGASTHRKSGTRVESTQGTEGHERGTESDRERRGCDVARVSYRSITKSVCFDKKARDSLFSNFDHRMSKKVPYFISATF
jgi:hypothetical protein